MSAANSKVVHIQNLNGETNQYVKVSARVPAFLAVYGPDKGYRVLAHSTDYLDFAQGRKELCIALAAQGKLPEQHLKELMEERKVVFKSQLVDKDGNVVAESSGSTLILRTLQRSLIMGKRSVYVKEKKIQFRVQTWCC